MTLMCAAPHRHLHALLMQGRVPGTAAHIGAMDKILVIKSSDAGTNDIVLPYSTPEDASRAWYWLVENLWLTGVGDRPGESPGSIRLLMQRYLKEAGDPLAKAGILPPVDGELAQLFISHLYGAELNAATADLITP